MVETSWERELRVLQWRIQDMSELEATEIGKEGRISRNGGEGRQNHGKLGCVRLLL